MGTSWCACPCPLTCYSGLPAGATHSSSQGPARLPEHMLARAVERPPLAPLRLPRGPESLPWNLDDMDPEQVWGQTGSQVRVE